MRALDMLEDLLDVFFCSNRGRWTESLLFRVHLPLVLPLNLGHGCIGFESAGVFSRF